MTKEGDDDQTQYPARRTSFRELISILSPYKGRWIASLILSFVQVVFFIQVPSIMSNMVDALQRGSRPEMLIHFLWFVICIVANSVALFIRLNYFSFYMANEIIYDVRTKLVSKILDQSYQFRDTEQSGDLVSTVTTDVNMIRDFLAFQIAYLGRNILQLAGLIIMLLFISSTLLLMLVPILPFLAITMLVYWKKIHPITYKQRKIFGDLTARLQENISGVMVVRAFANETIEEKMFDQLNSNYAGTSKRIGKMASMFDPTIRVLINIGRAVILGFGGYLILKGTLDYTMTLAEAFAFIPALSFMIEPIRFITWMAGEYGRIQAAYDRIRRILELKEDIIEKDDAISLPRLNGDVTFKDVTFSYEDGNTVVRKINFHVPAGQTVALLGATGSGKSTIINLLARFYDINEGSIILDNKWDIRDVKLDSYRKQVGIVAQEPFLFQQSIIENLTHGVEDTPMDKVIQACTIADIHDFISSKAEDGYDTIVGERGVTVSGGQKQRLTIARAILRDPRILILDAATSSVDVDTEYEILMSLKKIFNTCTTFIITQRLSTVRNADVIYMFENGEIAESGTHDELMDKNGLYATLYNTITYSPENNKRRVPDGQEGN
ncbi:MAG: ABC transporter ATP-binding protein [Candidatus Hodarchaeota archaeon]